MSSRSLSSLSKVALDFGPVTSCDWGGGGLPGKGCATREVGVFFSASLCVVKVSCFILAANARPAATQTTTQQQRPTRLPPAIAMIVTTSSSSGSPGEDPDEVDPEEVEPDEEDPESSSSEPDEEDPEEMEPDEVVPDEEEIKQLL